MQRTYQQIRFFYALKTYLITFLGLMSLKRLIVVLALILIRGYQVILSPVLGPACRFYPSCSEYALQAIERHGIVKGIYLSVRRLLRCHPFHPGGIDLVP